VRRRVRTINAPVSALRALQGGGAPVGRSANPGFRHCPLRFNAYKRSEVAAAQGVAMVAKVSSKGRASIRRGKSYIEKATDTETPTVQQKRRVLADVDIIKILEDIIEQCGESEFLRLSKIALGKKGRGRPPGATRYATFDIMALIVAHLLVSCTRGRVSVHRALTMIVEESGLLAEPNQRAAAVKRLMAKSKPFTDERHPSEGMEYGEWEEFIETLDSLSDDKKFYLEAFGRVFLAHLSD
jgi:hypothetical protein